MKSVQNMVILLVWMCINSKGVSGLMQLSLPSVKYLHGPTVADDDVYYGYTISFDNSTENIRCVFSIFFHRQFPCS